MLRLYNRNIFKLREKQILQKFQISRFYSETTTSSITEESDFAFRKSEISKLSFIEQDKEYYPLIGDCIKQLKEGINGIERIRIPEFRKKYFGIINNDNIENFNNESKYIICGKIKSIRKAGKGSIFIDIIQDFEKIQFLINHKIMNLNKEEFNKIHLKFKPGDQIIGIGKVGITKVGELSLKLIKPLILTSPSLHPIPPKFNDIGKINKNRVINYLVNEESKEIIILRSKIIKIIRNFFEDKGFLNIETPIICNGNSGANAKPFETKSQYLDSDNNSNDIKLNLRVAPELWLKKLIISGFDKIYEIGKSFRNEGIDSTHNPEFTTCEFYQTFIELEDLMNISEELIKLILKEILKDFKFSKFHLNCQELNDNINKFNNGKFKRIEFLNELEKQTGVKLNYDEINLIGLRNYYKKINKDFEIEFSENELINKLSEEYLEPLCDNNLPTFIFNIPEIISPLSKSNYNGISRRFEMFIDGREYINAYEEENNPFKQKFKFEKQLQNRIEFNDFESLIPDYKFVENMEWGMPPTGGWGMGIDRLVMKLCGVSRIENVLAFGKLNDVIKQ
ncbi:hypothetical protein C6P40_000057 [Pichia californica]|uniref:Lysyl-tRNA synthetase n=1 Tax=Pichia californica TaxID=460514 RepID=A0A9P6WQG8_9ASCO|nr:hypothetical protein C6P42_000809 [[Candida] californica]KAG0691440.1 hypothetical protein C6P40_000057 [[Candida] californica]